MFDLRERSLEGPPFQVKFKTKEGKIRPRNVNHGQALHDIGRKAICAL